MSEPANRPWVRPAFRRWSLAAFLLLIPVVAHAAWAYLEAKQFHRTVAEIRAKAEPVTLGEIRTRPVHDEGFRSDRYYRAAAVLASNRPQEQGFFERVREAERKGVWPDGLAEDMKRQLGEREDALQLLDRGAPLTFEGFSLGTEASSALFPLARLAGLRTMSLVLEGRSDPATASLYSELRLRPVVEWAWPIFKAPVEEVDRVGRVLSSTHPTSTALSRIARALVDLDRDDALKQWFLRRRAMLFNSTFGDGPFPRWAMTDAVFDVVGLRGAVLGRFLGQPWFESQIRGRAERLSLVIAALDQAWPARADAVTRVYDGLSPAPNDPLLRRPDVSMSKQIVDDLALVRAARVAVAIERYRREHAERMPARLDDLIPDYLDGVPVDPYSGWRLLLRAEARSYAVYSVGPNRRDDSGDLTLLRFSQGVRESRDVGLRIQYR